MRKLVLLIMIVLAVVITASNPMKIVKLTIKNKAEETIYIRLQGLSYDFEKEMYDSQHWGQFYYFEVSPNFFTDQAGVDVILPGEVVIEKTLLKDRYTIDVIYDQEHKYNEALGAFPVCKTNITADKYNDEFAFLDMDGDAKMSINKCLKVPVNRGDLDSRIFKWFRPWFLKYVYGEK